MSRTNKNLEDYQRIISGGYTLSLNELRHMNTLWQNKLTIAKKEIDKGSIETNLIGLKRRLNIDCRPPLRPHREIEERMKPLIDEIIEMLGEIP